MRFLRPRLALATLLAFLAPPTGGARADELQTVPSAHQIAPTVFVHIDAGPEVELVGRWPDGRWLSFFCTAPCDRAIAWDAEYQLNVAGQPSSSTFLLDASPGQHVVITVTPASNVPRVAGVALVVAGVAAIPTGLLLTLGGALSGACFGSCSNPPPSGNTGLEVGGLVMAVTGVGALVGGALLLQVTGHVGARQTLADILLPKSQERSDTAWLRAPMWRDPMNDGAMGGNTWPPIFSGRF